MKKADAKRIAEEYVLQHKDRYGSVAKKDIKQAVAKVAKALSGLSPTAITEPEDRKERSRVA